MKKTQATIPVSVVIVTRNRAAALTNCLVSLLSQTVRPAELIVVDNASTDQTPAVVRDFAKKSAWVVRRVVETKLGYPVVYNRGLVEAKQDWVVFVDDDCRVVPSWLESYWAVISAPQSKRHQNRAALVGVSETIAPATVWSLAVLAVDKFWKLSAVQSDHEIKDLETLDNKNIAYYKPFLTKHACHFNETVLDEPGNGAAEDADLGMQLQSRGGTATLVPSAVVFHADPNRLVWYFRRLFSGARANYYYQQRWLEFRRKSGLMDQRSKQRFLDFWPRFCADQHLSGFQSVLDLVIIGFSFNLIHFWHWCWSQQSE